MRRERTPTRLALGIATTASILLGSQSMAGTIVSVQTSLGEFFVEVDEQAAPITAGNFLNYVRSGRYDHTFIHGATGNSVIRGGGFNFEGCGAEPIVLDAPIPKEDTGLSNLNGTIAALRPSAEIDGATSQWFINIGDDPLLDTLDGGYAVFGKVLGNGLDVVSAISVSTPVRLAGLFLETPSINYTEEFLDCQRFSSDNLVQILTDVIEEDPDNSVPSASYNPDSNLLEVNLDLQSDGFTHLTFEVESSAASVTLRGQLDSAFDLQSPVPNMATYDEISGELHIPSISVDGSIQYRNVVLDLQDTLSATFTLRSFEL